MTRLKVGALYFVTVFSIAFVFGSLRVLFLTPLTGETWAVLLEVLLLIIVSWIVSSRLLKKYKLQSDCLGSLIVGGSAFVVLILTEFLLSILAFGQSSVEFLDELRRAPGVIGFLGQVFFGLIPFLQVASAEGDCKEFLKRSDTKKV